MKTKLLSFLLIFTMLMAVSAPLAFATGEGDGSDDTTPSMPALASEILVVRYGEISVDGAPEMALVHDLAFAANGYVTAGGAWNNNTGMLYLSMISELVTFAANGKVESRVNHAITAFTVELGEVIYDFSNNTLVSPTEEGLAGTLAQSADGSLAELAIPLKALTLYQTDDGTVHTPVKITAVTNDVSEIFDGSMIFNLDEVTYSNTVAGVQSVADVTPPIMYSKYGVGETFYADDENGFWIQKASHAAMLSNEFRIFGYDVKMFEEGAASAVSFDFSANNNMPICAPSASEFSLDYGNKALTATDNGMRSLIYIGIGSGADPTGATWRRWATSQFVFAIYNTAEGLVLYLDDGANGDNTYGESFVKLDRSAGTTFNLQLKWVSDGNDYVFTVLVDNQEMGTLTAPKGNIYTMPMVRGCGVAFGSAVNDLGNGGTSQSTTNFTYKNLVMSKVGLGNPALLLDGVVGSFNGNGIDLGKTVSDNMMVTHGKINVDGNMGEYQDTQDADAATEYLYDEACLVPDTMIGDGIFTGAVWSKNTGMLYLSAYSKVSSFASVSVEIGGVKAKLTPVAESVDGIAEFAFGEDRSTVEMAIPMSTIEFYELGDQVAASMKITVISTMAEINTLEGMMYFSADQVFSNRTSTTSGYLGYVRSEMSGLFFTIKSPANASYGQVAGGHSLTVTGGDATTNEKDGLVTWGYAEACYSNVQSWLELIDVYAETDLLIKALAVGEPQIAEVGGYKAANPARIRIVLGRGYNGGYAGETMILAIYNTGEDGLMIVRDNNTGDYDDANRAMLGVSVGEAFTLGMRWNVDNSVVVYVNDVAVAQFASTTSIASRQWSSNGYGFYIAAIDGDVTQAETGVTTVDLTTTNTSMARAYAFDSEFFMSVADGNTITDDLPGGIDRTKKPVNDNKPPVIPNTPNSSTNTGKEDVTDAPLGETQPTDQGKKRGCKSVLTSGSAVSICILAICLLKAKKKED